MPPHPLTIVVPTYREADNLPALIARLAPLRESLNLELLIVDDNSDDNTPGVFASLNLPWIRLITRANQRGLSTAVLDGIRAARHDTIVVMDADLSHPPEKIPDLLHALNAGAEIAVGSRHIKGGSMDAAWPLARRLSSRAAALLARPFSSIKDPTSGFFAFNRHILSRADRLDPIGYKILLELIVRCRVTRITEVPIHFADRVKGASKLSTRVRLQYLQHLTRLHRASPAIEASPSTSRHRWLIPALLTFLTIATYARITSHDLLEWDDRFHTVDNPHLNPITKGSLAYFWQHSYGNLYIPVAYNVFAAELAVARSDTAPLGVDPRPFHALSVILHTAITLLLYALLRRLNCAPLAAALGAAVFAIHPIQTEAVAWLSETRGLLAAFFCIAALVTRAHPHQSAARQLAAIALLTLGMLAKPSVVPVPAIALAIDTLWLGRPLKRSLLQLTPWFAVALATLIAARLLQNESTTTAGVPLWCRPFIAADAIVFYLRKLLWPFDLAPDYTRTPAIVLKQWGTYALWLIPVVLVALVAITRRARALATAAAIFLLGVAPVLGILTFDHQVISTVADRYLYLSMLGIALAIAAIIPLKSKPARIIAFAVVALLALRSFNQAAHWKSDISLWSHNARINPASSLARNNLGYALALQGRYADAESALRDALRLDPTRTVALVNLAWVRTELGDTAAALDFYQQALAQNPNEPRAHNGIGRLLANAGHVADALPHFAKAVVGRPRDPEALGNLGLALTQLGRPAEGLTHLRAAAVIAPRDHAVQHNLGLTLAALCKADDAIAALTRATQLAPDFAESHLRLADTLASAGRLEEARAAYTRASTLTPASAEAFNNLGLVDIRLQRYADAVAAFVKAEAIAPGDATIAGNLKNARTLLERNPR